MNPLENQLKFCDERCTKITDAQWRYRLTRHRDFGNLRSHHTPKKSSPPYFVQKVPRFYFSKVKKCPSRDYRQQVTNFRQVKQLIWRGSIKGKISTDNFILKPSKCYISPTNPENPIQRRVNIDWVPGPGPSTGDEDFFSKKRRGRR